ncbi:MAG: DUF3034 family protein [Betaproteobacteria bacterium]|nr:DUF3034 family protein [Betaproteobacteria bacterium]
MGRWILVAFLGVAFASVAGDRLVVTGGAQQLEGSAGGGLVPWALIAGYGTRDQVGGSAFVTRVRTNDFDLTAGGLAVGLFDRVELSLARQRFDAGAVVPGLVLRQDILGAKWRLTGDALYDQDSPWPQVALGLQHKRNRDMAIPEALGAKRGSDTDLYAAFTKLWLAGFAGRNVLANLTVRSTRANQMGLLGFGGDKEDRRRLEAEGSVALMLGDRLAVGAEYRGKPDNLSALREDDFSDVFVAWFPNKRVAVTLAWTRLGSIAGLGGQEGAYLSVQLTD